MKRRSRPTPWRSRWGRVACVVLALGCVACAEQRQQSDDQAGSPIPTSPPGFPPSGVPSGALLIIRPGATSGGPVQAGSAAAKVSVSTLSGGNVTRAPGPTKDDHAFEFPPYVSRGDYPRAVITATDAGSPDVLNPGTAPFTYGADFRLADVSAGRVEDNGNNVMQRGLSSNPRMFKIDVDAGLRPECTVKGSQGTVTVYASDPVEPRRWYRVWCHRGEQGVRITVGEILPSGGITATARRTSGVTGSLALADTTVPVAVGGKVARDGSIIASAWDQFNGRIANPFLSVSASR